MLLLVRHGETQLNAARVMQPADTPLSARGLAQARALAQRLAALPPTLRPVALVASDLPRALQTAQAVADATGLPVLTSALLHERNFGDWRGRPHDSLGFNPLLQDQAPPGGESMAAFDARVAQAWRWVLQRQASAGGPLAVVTHGLVVLGLLRQFAQPAPGLAWPERIANTSLSVVDARPPHQASLVDCCAHLREDGGALADNAAALSGG